MLPALSAILLYILLRRAEAGDDCLPYLGIAAGFFGKLRVKAADSDSDLFVEMSELLLKAQSTMIVQYADRTPPQSNVGSVEDEAINMQSEGGLGRFDFPHDISNSIFDTSSLEDILDG